NASASIPSGPSSSTICPQTSRPLGPSASSDWSSPMRRGYAAISGTSVCSGDSRPARGRAHLASGPDASPSGFEVVLHRHQGPVDVQALEVREAASPRDDAVEEPRGPIGPLPAVVGP